MADNIAITAGSGTSVATDEVGTDHYQKIKLALGAADTAVLASPGAGAVDTGTLRTTLASDDPAVALLGTIDTDTSALAGAVSGTEVQVDVVAALPAGTNNIGDVDVATLPSVVSGPSDATAVDSYSTVLVDIAAAATAHSIVAAPGASKQIWVYGLFLKTNGTTATIVLEDSTPTDKSGTITLTDSDGFIMDPSGNFEMPWIKCATNTAFRADTTGSGTIDGTVTYAVVSV